MIAEYACRLRLAGVVYGTYESFSWKCLSILNNAADNVKACIDFKADDKPRILKFIVL